MVYTKRYSQRRKSSTRKPKRRKSSTRKSSTRKPSTRKPSTRKRPVKFNMVNNRDCKKQHRRKSKKKSKRRQSKFAMGVTEREKQIMQNLPMDVFRQIAEFDPCGSLGATDRNTYRHAKKEAINLLIKKVREKDVEERNNRRYPNYPNYILFADIVQDAVNRNLEISTEQIKKALNILFTKEDICEILSNIDRMAFWGSWVNKNSTEE